MRSEFVLHIENCISYKVVLLEYFVNCAVNHLLEVVRMIQARSRGNLVIILGRKYSPGGVKMTICIRLLLFGHHSFGVEVVRERAMRRFAQNADDLDVWIVSVNARWNH